MKKGQWQANRGCFEAAGGNRCWKGTLELCRGGHRNGAPANRIVLVADWAALALSAPQSTWPRLSVGRGLLFAPRA